MENKEDDYKAMQLRNEPYKAIARRYETGKIGFYDAMHEAFNLPKPISAVDELNLDERAKNWANANRELLDTCVSAVLAGSIGYKSGYEKAHHNHASFVALVEGEIKQVKNQRNKRQSARFEHQRYAKIEALTKLLTIIKL